MSSTVYDAIVIGARCAGSPIAMLLARKGYRVLLLDRATFPSDTVSTHLIHPPGVAALERWGLLEPVVATGCPPIHTYHFDFGPVTLTGSPGTPEHPVSYAPRRTVLDKLLVDAAALAGVEVREGFQVEGLVMDGSGVSGIRGRSKGGPSNAERARVVVGADGLHSFVAETVQAERYHEKPPLNASYYTYWSGLPTEGRFETYLRPQRGFAVWPTNDDRTLVICGWPYAEFQENKKDVEGHYLRTLEAVPAFADRIASARREERIVGTFVPNFFRKPYGPGWALVGDAGYNRDYITAQGMSDAFLDAERCAEALDEALSGKRPYHEALEGYREARDRRVLAMYEFTAQIATLEPPPPDLQQLFGAMAGNREAMDGFARVTAGVTSPSEFFSEENVGRIFASASSRGG
jgi:2-polyprenyl-6-methoxyphenol hydroxylase-like FAD-dependent oxidoreductase